VLTDNGAPDLAEEAHGHRNNLEAERSGGEDTNTRNNSRCGFSEAFREIFGDGNSRLSGRGDGDDEERQEKRVDFAGFHVLFFSP